MTTPQIEGYARALFEVARADGTLDEVEDELFRFARSYETSDALSEALTWGRPAKRQWMTESRASTRSIQPCRAYMLYHFSVSAQWPFPFIPRAYG